LGDACSINYQAARICDKIRFAEEPWEDYSMQKAAPPISFAGSQLGEARHVCAFFNSDGEEDSVLLPFIKDGFACGDKAVHVVNPDQNRDHLQRLAAAGIDPAAAQQSGQLELRTSTETYLRDGRFDQDRIRSSLTGATARSGRPFVTSATHW